MLRNWGSRRGLLALGAGIAILSCAAPASLSAQSNSGIVEGTVTDPSKAAVPGAKVRIENPVSHHVDEVQTGSDGNFQILQYSLQSVPSDGNCAGLFQFQPRR